MVVNDSDVTTSLHFTLHSLKALVMGLISSMAVSGEAPSAESLMKLIIVEFIVTGLCTELGPPALKTLVYVFGTVALPTRVIFHSRKLPLPVTVHITLSWSPLQTGAVSDGDNITTPA